MSPLRPDVTIQKQVVELLLKLQNDILVGMFISHDISLIGMTCHSMMVMKDGKIVERGTTQKYWKIRMTPTHKISLCSKSKVSIINQLIF